MFSRVTGREIGKDNSGKAKMYQTIDTLTRQLCAFKKAVPRGDLAYTLQNAPSFPLKKGPRATSFLPPM